MASTTLLEATTKVRGIGGRTDFAGDPVTDVSAEEDRYPHIIQTEGAVTADAFVPASGSAATMDVVFGSGSAKSDYYLVEGDTAGQGNYVVRLAGSTYTVAIDAADASLGRIDQVYLVVADDSYDSGGLSLPVIGYRKGDAAGSPVAPGPDAGWEAYSLLAEVNVPGAAADILACTITDKRIASGIAVEGLVNGVDIEGHAHTGTDGGIIDAGDLSGMKAAVDAANVDADTLDGLDAADLAPIEHVGDTGSAHGVATTSAHGFMSSTDKSAHDAAVSKLSGIETGATADQTAAQIRDALKTVDGSGSGVDADLLDGQHASAFALASHGTHVSANSVTHDDIVTLVQHDINNTSANIGTGITPLSCSALAMPSKGLVKVDWHITIERTNANLDGNFLTVLPRNDGSNMDSSCWFTVNLDGICSGYLDTVTISGTAIRNYSSGDTSVYSIFVSKSGLATFNFQDGHMVAHALPTA